MADIAQIQIIPVDNGYFIQVVNADGSGTLNPRRVANDQPELVKQIKQLADGLYTKEPQQPGTLGTPPQPAQTPPVEDKSKESEKPEKT